MAATWFKAPDNAYVNIAQLTRVYVAKATGDTSWGIWGTPSGASPILLWAGFTTQNAAQNALDSNIGLAGGSV